MRFDALRSGKPVPVNLDAVRRKLLVYAEQKYLPAVDRLSAGYTRAERAKYAHIVALDRQDVLHGLEQGYVPEAFEPVLRGMLGHQRCPVAIGEAMPFLAMLLELRHESLTDTTRTFPLRVERLAARRALLALDGAPVGAAAPASQQPQAPQAGRRIADALDAWKGQQQSAKTIGAFTRHVGQFAAMMGDPMLSSISKAQAIAFRDKLQQWCCPESPSTWQAATSAEAAAAEGHEFTPAVEDDDIEGALTSAVAQGAGESPLPIEVAVNLPHPVKVERDSGGERVGRVMTRDAESSQTPNPGKGNSYKHFAAVAAAAGEAAALEGEVREWLRLQRKARDFSPANVLAMIQRRSKAFRAEVARQLGPAARAKTVQGIFAEHERGLLQKLKDAGFQTIAIPNRAGHMRAAVAELVRQVDAGKKPSAAAAAPRGCRLAIIGQHHP
jgi:hypothetical protein